jgi:fibronectin-binding autotransporter adhesin
VASAALGLLLLPRAVYAANGTWNVNASGAWTDAPNWVSSTIADGTGSTAFFTFNITANRTVTLAADRTIGSVVFTDATSNSHNLAISGPSVLTLDVTTGAPVINVTQAARTLTIASEVAGVDGLQKIGPGSLVLSAANTYTGDTIIAAGTLQIGSGTTGSIAPSGGIVNNATLAFGRTNTITQGTDFGTVISGTGTVTKLATGTLVLNGTNSYTGATRINALGGTLEVTQLANGGIASSIGASSGAAANLLLGRTTTLRYTGSSNASTDRSFTINGTSNGHGATIDSSGTGTLSFTNSAVALAYGTANQTRTLTLRGSNTGTNTFGKIIANNGTGATSVTKADAGLWILDQANTYTGTTTVSAGTLRAATAGQAFGTLSAVSLANVAGAVLDLNGFDQTIGSLATGGTTGGNVWLGTGTLTTGGLNTNTSYAGVISGSGGLTKVGSGTQTLSRTSTYTGPTLISAGTLQIGSGSSTGTLSPSSSITNDATLAFNRTGTITQGTHFASVIAGTGGVTKLASGTLVLGGTNTYTGPTVVNGGTLQIGAGGTTGSLSPSSAITTNATLAFSRTNTITQGSDFAGLIGGTGGVTKLASGRLVLNGNNTYGGVTRVSGGTLEVSVLADGGSPSSIGSSSNAAGNLLLSNATTFRYTGVAGAATDRGFTINGTSAGHGATIESSGAGTLSFTTGGSLAFGTANQTRRLTLAGSNGGNNTFAKVIGNNGTGATSLTKSGAGRWILTQANSYTGGTTVTGGTLLANNAGGSATGTGTVVVNAGATFGGTGSIAGALTINSGGTLSPGASVESLASGTLTFGNNSTFDYEVDSSAPLSAAADLQVVTGNLTISNGVGHVVTLDLFDLAAFPTTFAHNTTFTLINYSGTWNGGLFTVDGNVIANGGTFTAGLTNWKLTYDATSGGVNFSGEYVHTKFVNMVALPEPPMVVLLAAGGLAGFVLLRRRRPVPGELRGGESAAAPG